MAVFLGLNVADSIVTWFALQNGALEANWFRYLFGVMPIWSVLLLKMALAGACAVVVYRCRRTLFRPLNAGMTLVVGFNLAVLVGLVLV